MLTFNDLRKQYGETLPENLTPGPILSFFHRMPPQAEDRIWLLYTAPARRVRGATDDNALATQTALCDRFQMSPERVPLLPMNSPARHPDFDPSDHAMVISRMRECAQRIMRDSGEGWEVCVIYSSGTPQMQAAWLLLVNSGLLPARLFRAEGGEVEIEPLFEDQLLREACQLFKVGTFRAASEVFQTLEKRAATEVSEIARDRKALFRIWARVSEAYQRWSAFEYREAYRKLEEAVGILDRFIGHKRATSPTFHSPSLKRVQAVFQEQIAFLKALPDTPHERLRDLYYFNAKRHYEQENYMEAVWRLDALCELATVVKALEAIEQRWGVRLKAAFFSDQVAAQSPQLGEFITTLYKGDLQRCPHHLTEHEAFRILQQLDPAALERVAPIDTLWLSGIRNRAIHRASPIEENEAYRALNEARRYVRELFGQEVLSEQTYPFRSDVLQDLAEQFQHVGSGRF